MPNHITTIITTDSAEHLKIIIDTVAGDGDQLFDFNRVIPKPGGFKDTSGHMGLIDKARALVGIGHKGNTVDDGALSELMSNLSQSNFNRAVAEPLRDIEEIDIIADMARNYMISGHVYWYDWNSANWGTKWNAYDVVINDASIKIETAWSCPTTVLEALSKMLPHIPISVRYADEDTGCNCGSFELMGGSIVSQDIAPRHADMTPEEKYKWIKFALAITHPETTPEKQGYDTNGEYSEELYDKHNPEEYA
ncbi:hypothetical protein [uncultured Paraglaciecola sp.]|uniref:DUF1281 family ferredoxin-like fold protein n=1 Tax=uncultured Paraglaciecola sp. TaxID=1765024 RepID=UPI00262D021E|nr:hypothetical protein [uncultured Paraglaciecola sp.]